MFDGICLNPRILGSRFDQAMNYFACTAPGAEDASERMEIRHTSFLLKNTLLLVIGLNVRTQILGEGPLRRTFSPNFFGVKLRHDFHLSSSFPDNRVFFSRKDVWRIS